MSESIFSLSGGRWDIFLLPPDNKLGDASGTLAAGFVEVAAISPFAVADMITPKIPSPSPVVKP